MPARYPVPSAPPADGTQITVAYGLEWQSVLIDRIKRLYRSDQWDLPPDNIDQQVQELIDLLITPVECQPTMTYPRSATISPLESYPVVGNPEMSFIVISGAITGGAWARATPAQNDAYAWRFPLKSGYYVLEIGWARYTALGIASVRIDPAGSSFGQDMYGSSAPNQRWQMSFNQAEDGECVVTMTVASKNAASGGYNTRLHYLIVKEDIGT